MDGLRVSQEAGVLRVELCRPKKGNALDRVTVQAVRRAFTDAKKKKGLRLAVLSGAGADFCTGADLGWMGEAGNAAWKRNRAEAAELFAMYRAILEFPRPLLGLVQGRAYGVGVGLAAACDVLVCRSDAEFCLSEARWGLVPGIISPIVAWKIGPGQFNRLALTAEPFGAQEALRLGLAHFVGVAGEADQILQRQIGQIRRNAPGSLESIKKLARQWRYPLRGQAGLVELIAKKRADAEAQSGIEFFLRKQTPVWPD